MSELEHVADEELMIRIIGADHEAFSELVGRHTKMFYAAAYRMCANQNDAEDIVQDAFLKLWQRPEAWQPDRAAKFTTWFYRVVTNLSIDHMRKAKKTQNTKGSDHLERIKDSGSNQQELLERHEQHDNLERAIQALPERQKVALNLCFYEGLSNKEAAEIMEIGVKALESLLIRAKAGVKTILMREGVLDDNLHEPTGGRSHG